MSTRFQHTCPICQHRSLTLAEADAHAYAHECGTDPVADDLPWIDEPQYTVAWYAADETQGMLPAGPDYALISESVREWNRRNSGIHYMIADFDDDALLAEVNDLKGADIAAFGQAAP